MRTLLIAIAIAIYASPQNPVTRVSFKSPEGAYAVVRFSAGEAGARSAAAAVDVVVDDRIDQIVVLTPGVTRPHYETLLGPLSAGSHEVRLKPSSLWQWDTALKLERYSVDVIPRADPRFDAVAHAPAIGLRPDTIATASDLPLLMYVEETKEGASRWLRYSVIFSHEDGGTPGVALMARWGRTTDIELAYEVELRDGRVVQARYQGPDHRVIQRMDTSAPLLLVSTLNNMFLDRGRSPAVVRIPPIAVDLTNRSRESVMDDAPWIYRVMARELATERPAGVGDPRDYVYVDLRLATRAAGIALGVRDKDGMTQWSDRGRSELVVSRQGELRIAIPMAARHRPVSLTVRCDPRVESGQPAEAAQCDAELRKAFRLDADHQPSRTLIEPARLTVAAGTARDIPFSTDKD